MLALYSLKYATLICLFALILALMLGQLAHAFLLAYRRDGSFPVLAVVYEYLLAASMLLAAILVRDACNGYGEISLWLYGLLVPAELVSWANLLPLLVGTAVMLVLGRPQMLLELLAVALWLPPVAAMTASLWAWLMMASVVFLVFRTAWMLCLDYRHRSLMLTRFSFIEAIDTLPEGVLCGDSHGRVLIANSAMRSLLQSLGHKGMLSDSRSLFACLRAYNSAENPADGPGASETRLQTPGGQIWRICFDELEIAHRSCQRALAFDVTELEQLNKRIDAANSSLMQAEGELVKALALVHEVAALDAQAKMRKRVHDVIGQRLSLLHRCLEDGNLSPETLRVLSLLVDEIMADLAGDDAPDPQSALSHIQEAFALIGVDVCVEGELPAEHAVASVYAQVIREAVTNAVRHGQARRVDVCMQQAGSFWELTVENETPSQRAGTGEGTGIPGMRHSIQELGGSLEIRDGAVFELCARVPLERADVTHKEEIR